MKYVKPLLEKYRILSLPAKASLWYVFCSLLQKGISFLTTPIFTRLIDTEEYGEITLYGSWLEIITIFATFQLSTGVFNKAMIKYEDDRDGYTSSSLVLTSIITIAVFLVYICAYPFWDNIFDLPHFMSLVMFADILISTPMAFWSIRNRFEYKYKSVVVLTLLVSIVGPLSSIGLIALSDKPYQAEAKVLGLLIIKVLVYSFVFLKLIKKGKKFIVLDYWKYSLLYNLPLIPHYLSQQVLTQSDRIMINSICGKTDAAIYGVAYQLSMAAFIFTYAIHSSFTPWTFEKIRDKQYDAIRKKTVLIEVGIGVMCVVFSLFAPELIMILGGTKYMDAVWIVPPVAMSVLFQTIYTFYGNIEFYYEKTKFVMIASVICALANVGLNAVFIPIYGFVAAGYTTLFCYALYALVHFIFCKYILKQNSIQGIFEGKIMWAIGILFSGLSIVVTFVYKYTFVRFSLITIVIIISMFFCVKYKGKIKNILK